MIGDWIQSRKWLTAVFPATVACALFLCAATGASAQEADLGITKSGPAIAAANSNVSYTLDVFNAGPDDATTVSVSDPIPAGMTFVSLSSPAGWVCITPAPGGTGTVTCTVANFTAGNNANFALTLHIPTGTAPGTFFTNIATVTSATFDPNDENNSSTASTLVSGGASADVLVTKTGPATIFAGQNIVYSIQAGNAGPDTATSVTLSDPLPNNLTFMSLSAPAGWTCTTPAVGAGGTVSCSIPNLAAGATGTFTLTANVPAGTGTGTVYDNTATISSAVPDPASENNSGFAGTIVVAPSPDLTISKTHSGNATAGQTGFTYTITVSNVGVAPSSDTTTVQDILPAGLTATAMSGPGWSCNLGTLTCTRADALAPASSFPAITLTVNVAANAPNIVSNQATLQNPSDPNPDNDTANDPTVVVPPPAPDLAITKSHTGNPIQGQTGFSYTIGVTNVGTAPASGTTTVQDTLPAGLTATAIGGSGWSCTLGTLTCTRADALAAAAAFPNITLTVNVAANAPSSVTNTATVSNAGDANAANDTASDVTIITSGAAPDLAIAKSHSGNAQQGQVGFVYTITVNNVGSGATTGTVTVNDTVPAGLTATAISGAGWSCAVGATSTCTRSDALAAGASYPPITLTVNVAANAPTVVTNTAAVSTAGDPNAANNTASDPTTVTAGAGVDLSITKTHTGDARAGQINFNYTLTVSNVGLVGSTGTVTVTDILPAKLTAVAISGAGWACALGATPTCTRGDALGPGAAFPPITLVVKVAGDAPPTVTNTATVSGGGDGNPANNTATDQTVVKARPDPTKDPDVVGLISAQLATAQRFANTQISNFNERLESLHEENTGDQFGLRFGSYEQDQCIVPGTSMPRDPFDPKCQRPSQYASEAQATDAFASLRGDRKGAKAPPAAPRTRDFAFWTTGHVSFGSADPTVQRSSIDFNTSGVSAGVDYRFSRSFIAGIGVGYGRDWTKIGDRGTRSDAEAYNVAAYGSYRPFRNVFIDALAGYGALRFDSQRFVVDDAAFVHGQRRGNQWFGSLTAAYQYRQGGMMLSPYARINAAWVTLDAFTETGGLGGALAYTSQSAEFFTSVLGLRGKYTFLTDWGSIAPRFRVEYNHDFSGTSTIFLQYADLLGPTYSLTMSPANRDRMAFGLGTDLMIGNAHRLGADYQYDADFLGIAWHRVKLRWESRF
jgi:uncharacterized repeat protein (TIGR01451 family)